MLNEILTILGPVNIVLGIICLIVVAIVIASALYIAANWIVYGFGYMFGASWEKGKFAGQNSY